MSDNIRVLVVGLGNMGLSHALAYQKLDGFEIVGLVARGINGRADLPESFGNYPRYTDFDEALGAAKPRAVSINTWPDTHAEFAIKAMKAGAHVFVEKPIATTVEDAQAVVDTATETDRKLVVGYILRHHPSWMQLVEKAKDLGSPHVMRMNLNQQSHGPAWNWHKNLMNSLSPIVDCGVHYVDVMCQITGRRPTAVHAVGTRLSDEIDKDMYNYGHLHVTFDDGSVGWYEAGWGPMMSEVAFFVKDVVGPKGSVSIVVPQDGEDASKGKSADINAHTQTSALLVHHSELDADNEFVKPDDLIRVDDEPDHQALCDREQAFLLKAIREDLDLSDWMDDAVKSLAIVIGADESVRSGQVVALSL